MSSIHEKIILDADEHIVCPKCAHEFSLGDGITRQTIDRHAEEFDALLKERREQLELHLTQEAQRKAMQQSAEQIAKLKEEARAFRARFQTMLRDQSEIFDAESENF